MNKRNITKKGVKYKEKLYWADFMKEIHGTQVLINPVDDHLLEIYYREQLIGIATEVGVEEQKCRVCGCAWNNACEGGCFWVEEDLCSECISEV